jgi:predicted nucleotidyltransferase
LFENLGELSKGVSIAAVGGFGRGELSPGSDLDLLILHRNKSESELLEITNALLYPLWDQGFKVDHAVRTLSENREAADIDLRVVMGLLDIRLVAGDSDLVAAAQSDALQNWRKDATRYLAELKDANLENITISWKSREPKKIGKGKETITHTLELRYEEIIFRYELGIEHIKHYHREAYEEFVRISQFKERYDRNTEREFRERNNLKTIK